LKRTPEEYCSDTCIERKKMPTTAQEFHSAEIEIPEEVDVRLNHSRIVVTGPLGTEKKDFTRVPVEFEMDEDTISLAVSLKGKRGYALSQTVRSLVQNLFTGVTEGYTYRMKIYYAHFPFTVAVSGETVLIRNFTGEKAPRKAKIVGNTKVVPEEEEVVVTGTSKEDVSQTAANIRQACFVSEKDPRIFLDGIYVYSKEVGIADG
jgi:large subunit ribosomal protein L6